MFPLDPDLMMFLKFFILFTCLFFWIKLGYDAAFRSYRSRHHHHER
ncbi:MAG: hypothetical protein K8T26_15115 [Lentisphaerae bacterium]|nr:hypothetical protein [Lentisphaerota bacterium]